MSNPTLNVYLLEKLITYIEAHPEEHNQAHWGDYTPECGTTMCAAGHAIELAGEKVRWDLLKVGNDTYYEAAYVDDSIGEYIPIRARKILGLNPTEVNALFYQADNNEVIPTIEAIIRGEYRRNSNYSVRKKVEPLRDIPF